MVCKIYLPPVTVGESGAQTDSQPSQNAFRDHPLGQKNLKKCHKTNCQDEVRVGPVEKRFVHQTHRMF